MDRGGIETMLMNYYWHLDRDQFQFDFLVNKEKPGFFDDEVRSLGGRIFMGPGLSPLKYPEYLRYMKTLLDREKEIKVLHAHNEAMEFYALNGAKKAGFPVRIAHAHNTHLPRGLKLPVKLVCKESIISVKNDGTRAVCLSIMPSIWSGLATAARYAPDFAGNISWRISWWSVLWRGLWYRKIIPGCWNSLPV